MGVPKFFRWLSERYPKINQRYGSLPDPITAQTHFPERSSPPKPFEEPDPMATCGLAPPIDRLYLDMNGIIHGCSHNNNDENEAGEKTSNDTTTISNTNKSISREEIFRNVCYYLDRVIGDMVQPEQLVYMAIDGVAPRAKMNQQRSRRYRSGGEGEIETTIYEAHRAALEEQNRRQEEEDDDEALFYNDTDNSTTTKKHEYNGSYSFVLDADEGNALVSSSDEDENDFIRRRDTWKEQQQQQQQQQNEQQTLHNPNEGNLQEISRGRFKGKFEAGAGQDSPLVDRAEDPSSAANNDIFHSNEITPGTPFFAEFTKHLEHFVKHKLSTDPKWKKLTIIFSGSNVPGEGEHKIMQFLREQRDRPDYDPNLRHCIMGQDGDLMMLGLLTHEPNMVLLREKVVFNMSSSRLEKAHAAEAARKDHEEAIRNGSSNSNGNNLVSSLDTYIYNPHFEFLHLQVLRDYLAYEFETSNVLSTSPWDLERTIDDFVFLTFLIGNDFLPHLPALDIADQAFDLLFYTYKKCRGDWLLESNNGDDPYLTHAGTIVSGTRLEEYFAAVGSHEVTYYEKKKQTTDAENRRLRKQYRKLKMKDTLPDDSIVASKEEADRAAYRAMLLEQQQHQQYATNNTTITDSNSSSNTDRNGNMEMTNRDSRDEMGGFVPVTTKKVEFQPIDDELERGLINRMGTLLHNSLSSSKGKTSSSHDQNDDTRHQVGDLDDQDLKGRYYYDKFGFTPFDADNHRALRKAYMEGLVWNLKYYYEGCVSWNWYYPYHYGPMLSDLVGLDELLDEISFENSDVPLSPFDQLMGCMPPSQAHHLPEPYRHLMKDQDSPIIDFYPNSFVVDMNGKRWPWEAVTLLPFIDANRLLEATKNIDRSLLTPEEHARNATGITVVMKHDPETTNSETIPAIGKSGAFFGEIPSCQVATIPFESTDLKHTPSSAKSNSPVFLPEVKPGTVTPLPGFSTLRDAPVETLYRRRLGINVHGGKSRYKTASLEISSMMPPLPPVEALAPKLIGTTVFIDYPHFVEALVTAVSDETTTVRGKQDPRKWTPEESNTWKLKRDGAIRREEVGEGYCGTGGLIVPEDQPITLSVRPFQKFAERDGQRVKSFAVFEVEIPLVATFWAPSNPDARLMEIPSMLERNAYEIAESKQVHDPLLKGELASMSSALQSQKGKNHNKHFGKPRRRKLFPSKSPPSKSRTKNASKMKVSASAANYSSLPPKRHFSSVSSLSVNPTRTIQHSIFAPFDATIVQQPFSSSSSLQQWGASRSTNLLSSPFAVGPKRPISSCVMTTPQQLFPTRHDNAIGTKSATATVKNEAPFYSNRTIARRLGTKGRVFAAGLAMAACLWNPAHAAQETLHQKSPPIFGKRHRTKPLPLTSIYGGNDLEPQFEQSTSILESPFLPSIQTKLPNGPLETPFVVPRGGDTESYSSSMDNGFLPKQRPVPPLEFAHGTTTLSFAFKGGIIAAVDSRASMGQFVGSKTTQKVLPVNSHILGTMAGGAADCQHWIHKLKSEALLHEMTEDGRRMSVSRASRLLSNYMYALRGYDLSVGTMIMGFDDHTDVEHDDDEPQPAHIYYVDNTGLRIQGDMFSVGSGSTFALGILDSEPSRYNLETDDAIALGIRAIRHATFRDAYSGGYINVYLITPKDGWKKVYTEDIARTPEAWKSLKDQPGNDASK